VEITEVKVYPKDQGKVKGFAQITFDNEFVVKNLRIIQGKERFFVAMPSRKKRDGTHEDVAHPITNELRQKIEQAVLDEYKKATSSQEMPGMQGESSQSENTNQ